MAHRKLRGLGFTGSERTTRRAVAKAKAAFKTGRVRAAARLVPAAAAVTGVPLAPPAPGAGRPACAAGSETQVTQDRGDPAVTGVGLVDLELVEDTAHVRLDGPLREDEALGDAGVGVPFSGEG